jgi:hypothetical protein
MAHHFLGKHHKAATAAGEAEPPKVTDWRKEEKHHKHMEQLAQLGTVIAGAKKGPEHTHSHKIKEGVAAAVTVGSAGFSFHEHHQKKDAKKHRRHGHWL